MHVRGTHHCSAGPATAAAVVDSALSMGFWAYVQLTPWLSLVLMAVFIAACSLSGSVNPAVWCGSIHRIGNRIIADSCR